jgi:hypothetical protein
MTQRDGIGAYQDLLHQQAQDLLSYGDIQRLSSQPQLAAKPRQVLRQL